MRVFHETVGKLAHMHQPVLMHAHVDERAKRRHVRHCPLQQHPRLQVLDIVDPIRKRGRPERRPRVTPRLFQLRQNVLHRRQPEPLVDEIARLHPAQHRRVSHHRPQVAPAGSHDPPRQIIGLGMHRTCVQGLFPARHPQEPRRLFERLRTQPRHLQQFPPARERPVGVPVRHNGLGQPRTHPRHPRQQRGRRGVQVHPNRVHRIFDHRLQRLAQPVLIHVMLILPDADRLRLDLHQLRQRILQPPRNADRAAQAHVQPGKLLRRQFARRIDRRPRLGHDHLHRLFPRQNREDIRHHLLRLPARRAVADGDQLHPMLPDQPRQRHLCPPQIVLRLERIDGVGLHHLAGRINHRDLHPGPDAGVEAHRRLPTRRSRQKQILQVPRKDADRLGLGALAHLGRQVQRQARAQLHTPGPACRLAQPRIAGAARPCVQGLPTRPLAGAAAPRGIGIDLKVQRQNTFVAAPQHRQHPVARRARPSFGMREIVRELRPLGLFSRHHLGR